MRIAAISDFHIGATEQTDCFRHGADSFHSFLDSLEQSHDRIVLLGDIYQSEYGPWFGRAVEQRQLALGQKRLPSLWRRFQGAGYVYLHGNHDEAAAEANGALPSVKLGADGFFAYFIHGHQFDPLLQTVAPLARGSTWVSGRVRRVGLRAVADWLEHQDVSVKHRKFRGAEGPYALGARKLLRAQQVDAVIMGHTHVPQYLELPEGVYANTGTCSRGQRMFVTIDTASRTVRCANHSSRDAQSSR